MVTTFIWSAGVNFNSSYAFPSVKTSLAHLEISLGLILFHDEPISGAEVLFDTLFGTFRTSAKEGRNTTL